MNRALVSVPPRFRWAKLRWASVRWGGWGVGLALAAAVAGCGSTSDPRPAKWSYISPVIIQPSCATANCHSQLAARSGVVLDTVADGYQQLVQRNYVMPGSPDSSSLISLLRAQGSRRMPPDFPLPEEDVGLIASWIANGASWDGPGEAPPPLGGGTGGTP